MATAASNSPRPATSRRCTSTPRSPNSSSTRCGSARATARTSLICAHGLRRRRRGGGRSHRGGRPRDGGDRAQERSPRIQGPIRMVVTTSVSYMGRRCSCFCREVSVRASHVRVAACAGLLSAGLLVASTGGAVALADPDSSASTAHAPQGARESNQDNSPAARDRKSTRLNSSHT